MKHTLKLRNLSTLLAVLTAAFMLAPGCGPSTGKANVAAEAPSPPAPPPEVKVIPVEDVPALLDAPSGVLTVVNLWATWCPPCVAEMPELAKFVRESDAAKVRFVSLSYDKPDNIAKVKAFHKEKDLPFSVYILGEMDAPEAIDNALGVEFGGALPTTYIFQGKGHAVKTWEGAITMEMLVKTISQLG